MERQDRVPRDLGKPDRAGLRHAGRAPRSVNRKTYRVTILHEALGAQRCARGIPGRRSARGHVPEAVDDPGHPFAVEVVAGDDNDAAPAEVVEGGKDPAVPERHHGEPSRCEDAVEVLEAADLPTPGTADDIDHRVSDSRNRRGLESLAARRAPPRLGRAHSPSYCGPPPPSGGTHVITW